MNPGSNAIAETFSYNNRLQLTQIQAAKGSTTVMDFSYDYGTSSTNTGRVLKRTDALQPEHSAGYVYDPLYRLAQAAGIDGSWSISWVFDAWGNRTSQTPLGLATSKVGSQTIGYSSNKNTSHTYDSAGNTTNDGVHSYAYNAENQQTAMDGGTAIYAYDGEGRRMKKTFSGVSTYSFYGPGGLLCEFSTSSTDSSATAAGSSDRTLYRMSEKTGTAVLLFNTSGTVIENNRTLPYGEAWLSDTASANDKKFTTYDRDKESGLDYAAARMYASTGGRFTTPDQGPVAMAKPNTLNRYTYGTLDPINKKDSTGNASENVNWEWECWAQRGSVIGAWVAVYYYMFEGAYRPEWVGESVLGYLCDVPDALPYYAEEAGGEGGGGGGQNTYPAGWYGALSQSNAQTVNAAKDMAAKWTQDEKCDHALATDGIASLAALVNMVSVGANNGGAIQGTVWDGLTSANPLADKGKITTVKDFLGRNANSVGATTIDPGSGAIYLGSVFFNPGQAGVNNGFYQQAQAFILLHEAVHAFGNRSDSQMGGSKSLTQKIVDGCQPALASRKDWLGGLYN